MVSVNGMRFYLPFLYYLNKITRCKIYHYIIGSELLEMVKQTPKLIKYLNALTVNWFEYDSGTRYLQSKGVVNVFTLPNFKLITPVKKPVEYNFESEVFEFCTFSRVMEEKGITEAIKAVSEINKSNGKIIAKLDIYGQIEKNYASELDILLEANSDCVTYKGIVDSQESVDVLKKYYAMLFPTKWVGEGLPGTVIDAFASGIPVIASDWNANKDIIQNNLQGIIYPNENILTLKDAINYSLQETEKMKNMRHESLKAFERYTPDYVLQVILDKLNEQG
jgi:glycosyltransferase involved in cell wall biosynthesis